MHHLCLRVISGKLNPSNFEDSCSTYVVCRIGDHEWKCLPSKGLIPVYDSKQVFEVPRTVTHIIVELWEKKTFHSVNSSVVQLELIDIPFKNKCGNGCWHATQPIGRLTQSDHVLIDLHYLLPIADVSKEELALLEQKMNVLNKVQEDEMTTLKAQSQKNFQDIKGSNISRSKPGNGTHRPPQCERNDSFMTIDSCSDFRDAVTNESGSQNGDMDMMSVSMSHLSQHSSMSQTSADGVYSANSQPMHPRISNLIQDGSGNHVQQDNTDNNTSRSTSQFSLMSDEHEAEAEEVSKEALMWMSAVQRIRKNIYMRNIDKPAKEGEEEEEGEDGETKRESNEVKENGVYPPTEGEGGSLPRHENNSTVNSDNSSDMFDSEKVKSTAARMWDTVNSTTTKMQMYSKPRSTDSNPEFKLGDSFFDIANYGTLKGHVFRKTIQALIYPISLTEPHKFHSWSTLSPAFCSECEGLLWGITKQGMKCSSCGVKCHQKCQELLNADCLQRAHQKTLRGENEDTAQHEYIMRAIEQRMKVTENASKDTFELLRLAFAEESEKLDQVKKEVKHSILTGSSKWSAKIDIEVVEAQGLTGKDKSGTSDPYVTVQVGKIKKTTATIQQDLNPKWNENFSFDCNNSSDRIKVRVWDEDDDFKSRVMTHLKREADDFLGQAIIDVKQLCGETDVWIDLKQRTDRSDVSGQVHLRMTIKIEGEEQNMASYHIQYQILHETLFNHLCEVNNGVNIPPGTRKLKGDELDEWPTFFDGPAQYIVEEFATRFGIESIFMAMTQFSCLTQRFITKKDAPPQDVSKLLALINSHYRRNNGQEINVSNFGKQKFTTVLDRLQSSLRENLASYKAVYPSNRGQEKLDDLENSIALLTSIVFFRLKVLQQGGNGGGGNNRRTNTNIIIKDRVKLCLENTYDFISTKTDEVYSKYANTEENTEHAKIAYWKKLITLILVEMKEDKMFYEPIFNRFFPHAALSAQTFWELLSRDLKTDLTENLDAWLSEILTSDIMGFQMTVKFVYDKKIAHLQEYENSLPDYPKWFEPFVMKHLQESDSKIKNMFLIKSLDKDTFTVQPNQTIKHSSSVIDIFSSLRATYDSLDKMKCPIPALRDKYHNRFCETIDVVLIEYTKRIIDVFKKNLGTSGGLGTSCVILCNIHRVREELESIFKTMGGELLDITAKQTLEGTQKRLKDARNNVISDLVKNMKPEIEKCIRDIKNDLRNVRSKNGEDYTEIVSPLIEYFDVVFKIFVDSLYDDVRKPLFQQTWKRTLKLFEEIIILPDINCIAHEEVQELNSKQSQVVEAMLDMLKAYFTDSSGKCLKARNLEKMTEMRDLRKVLSQYRLTTDTLIKNFVTQADNQNRFAEEDSQGEIQLQVDLFTPPGQEHHDCTVKVVSASRLHWNTTKMFRPFVEVNLIGPGTSGVKRKFTTGTKNKTYSPLFNESFHLKIMKPNDPIDYELQFSVKDWCLMKTDLLVGVAVMPLRQVVETGSIQDRLDLGRSLYLTKENMSIVIILSQRVHDEVAQEFVKLKKLERTEIV